MRTKWIVSRICTLALVLPWMAQAQQMPQDNWRYDGLEFSGPDSNKTLRSIAIGAGGVYVGYGDPATSIVQFQENGTFIREFGTFTYILGIACDSAGNVYVLDRGDSKVKVFDRDGTFLRDWGSAGSGDGQFSIAAADGTTLIAIDSDDRLYVCDPGNARVQVFDTAGTFLRKWGERGSLPGQFADGNPQAIAIDGSRTICVETFSGSVGMNQFDSSGQYLRRWDFGTSEYLNKAMAPDGVLASRRHFTWWGGPSFYDTSGQKVFDCGWTTEGNIINNKGNYNRGMVASSAESVGKRRLG